MSFTSPDTADAKAAIAKVYSAQTRADAITPLSLHPFQRSQAVGAEYWVVAGQAAFRYSLMSPSHRLDFTTRRWRWTTEGGASVPSGGC